MTTETNRELCVRNAYAINTWWAKNRGVFVNARVERDEDNGLRHYQYKVVSDVVQFVKTNKIHVKS